MEITKLDKKSSFLKSVINDSLLESKTGNSLSRIEVYPSGANRIIGMNTGLVQNELPERSEEDIISFSESARRRYFIYVNSLNLEGFSIFFLTLTISSFFLPYLTRDIIRVIKKRFFKRLISKGFDYVYKTEYHKNGTPHFHILLYSRIKYGFKDENERIIAARKICVLWTDIVSDSINLTVNSDISPLYSYAVEKMYKNSADLRLPENIVKLIYYFSNYTSKNKDYQNTAPEKFSGLKFWGYSRENYPEVKEFPLIMPITREIYNDIFRMVLMTWKDSKKKKCSAKGKKCNDCEFFSKCTLYRKNGLYYPQIDLIIKELSENGRLTNSIQTDDFDVTFFKKYHEFLLNELKIEFPQKKLLTILN